MLLEKLLEKYSDEGIERLGFVLADESLVEVQNCHDDKEYGATPNSEEMFLYLYSGEYEVIATWHTHPNSNSNLTGDDYSSFKRFPKLVHYIVGKDGVSKYYVEDGAVKNG